MNIKDFKVGDTAWVGLTGNAAREKKDNDELIEAQTIIKVGRKYITAKPHIGPKRQFFKSNTHEGFIEKTNYIVNYVLYKDKQDILDIFETNDITKYLRQLFVYGRIDLPLDKLRRIKQIVDE